MDKVNRIDATKLVKATQDNTSNTTDIVYNGLEITINHTISLKDMCEFVDYVTKLCFSDNGEYLPEIKDFAIKNCLIEKYTNLALPDDVSEKYSIIYHSDIAETIMGYINEVQLEEIVRSINAKVSNLAQANIEMINAQMNKLNTEFENLIATFESMLEGVNIDDIKALAESIFNGSIDEGKFIKAYINSSKNNNVIPITGGGEK